jgi:hypothetical protein
VGSEAPMSGVPSIYHRNRVTLSEPDAELLRTLLIERGEPRTRDALGISRHVLLRAAARLPLTEADEVAIRAALRGACE